MTAWEVDMLALIFYSVTALFANMLAMGGMLAMGQYMLASTSW